MAVRIYSTLTGREDELVPLHPDGVLRMYVCGMTPKFHPHLGHARLFVAMDVIRRYLVFRGFQVKFVQNFTDVDDKIIQRALTEGRAADTTAQAYMDSYFDVIDRLNVRRADDYPTVTGYMERIVEFIAGLVETDHGYVTDSGDVYFGVSSFPEYGKLSHRDLNSQLVAARKELEPGKRDPRDFALWKHARAGEPSWASPWGRGRPGWHIECSAMVRETLGDQIDIHGGGADLIFPHHENEIAQSESLTGKEPFARYWAHAGLVILGGGENVGAKMAHSAENFTTLASILEKYDPLSKPSNRQWTPTSIPPTRSRSSSTWRAKSTPHVCQLNPRQRLIASAVHWFTSSTCSVSTSRRRPHRVTCRSNPLSRCSKTFGISLPYLRAPPSKRNAVSRAKDLLCL